MNKRLHLLSSACTCASIFDMRRIWLLAASAALFACGAVNAGTLTLEFDTSFGNPLDTDTAPPDGATPWLTAVFDDGDSAGSVTLTMTVSDDIGIAEIAAVYFNLDPVFVDPGLLSIVRNAGSSTGPVENSIGQSADAYKPDSDGFMDILFELPPPGGDRFGAGEVLVYEITGIASLTASSFDFFSAPDPGEANPTGPWRAAAKVSSTGSETVTCSSLNGPIGQCSDWIAPNVVPVPAAAWMFGSALGLLGWVRRRTSQA